MTDLSDLTTDELLAKVSGQYLALHGVAMDLHDELRRRLSAGEKAEKTARVIAAMLCDIPPDDADRLTDPIVAGVWHLKQQAEARVAELERERNEALARVDGGLWEDWLRASELRDVAERESDRLRAALYLIEREAGHRHWGSDPTEAEAWVCPKCIARRALSAGSETEEKDVPPEFARCLVYTAGVRCEGYANPSGRCDAHEGGNQ